MNRLFKVSFLSLLMYASYVGATTFTVVVGDITKQTFKEPSKAAIVNAANKQLSAGGGICGAIHKAAGPGLREECAKFPLVETYDSSCPDKRAGCEVIHPTRVYQEPDCRCNTGDAVITGGHKLSPVRIIHTVGPDISGHGQPTWEDKNFLARSIFSALNVAKENGVRTIIIPTISTGIYGYPFEKAIPVLVSEAMQFCVFFPGALDEIGFIVWDQDPHKDAMVALYTSELKKYEIDIK
jgi:O-acetyl-ADP-ribose deacetylase (regulator of RNase III)